MLLLRCHMNQIYKTKNRVNSKQNIKKKCDLCDSGIIFSYHFLSTTAHLDLVDSSVSTTKRFIYPYVQ